MILMEMIDPQFKRTNGANLLLETSKETSRKIKQAEAIGDVMIDVLNPKVNENELLNKPQQVVKNKGDLDREDRIKARKEMISKISVRYNELMELYPNKEALITMIRSAEIAVKKSMDDTLKKNQNIYNLKMMTEKNINDLMNTVNMNAKMKLLSKNITPLSDSIKSTIKKIESEKVLEVSTKNKISELEKRLDALSNETFRQIWETILNKGYDKLKDALDRVGDYPKNAGEVDTLLGQRFPSYEMTVDSDQQSVMKSNPPFNIKETDLKNIKKDFNILMTDSVISNRIADLQKLKSELSTLQSGNKEALSNIEQRIINIEKNPLIVKPLKSNPENIQDNTSQFKLKK